MQSRCLSGCGWIGPLNSCLTEWRKPESRTSQTKGGISNKGSQTVLWIVREHELRSIIKIRMKTQTACFNSENFSSLHYPGTLTSWHLSTLLAGLRALRACFFRAGCCWTQTEFPSRNWIRCHHAKLHFCYILCTSRHKEKQVDTISARSWYSRETFASYRSWQSQYLWALSLSKIFLP